jgi:hypothetical protein
MRVNPSSAIVIIRSAVVLVHGGVSVAAKNALSLMMTGVSERTGSDFGRQAQPARIEAIQKTRQGFIFRIPLLQLQVEQRANPITDADAADHEAIELMSVDGDVAQAPIFPLIFLIHADAHQMRHDFGESTIVIAFHPDHFDLALGIGELPNEAEKFPVLFFQTSEIEVGKDVSQKDETAIFCFLKNAQSLASAAHVRAEVQIREDQRVV